MFKYNHFCTCLYKCLLFQEFFTVQNNKTDVEEFYEKFVIHEQRIILPAIIIIINNLEQYIFYLNFYSLFFLSNLLKPSIYGVTEQN